MVFIILHILLKQRGVHDLVSNLNGIATSDYRCLVHLLHFHVVVVKVSLIVGLDLVAFCVYK